MAALAKHYRKQEKRVGIIAVDPTSPFTGGAILGDRIRMADLYTDRGVFIRSMATRGFTARARVRCRFAACSGARATGQSSGSSPTCSVPTACSSTTAWSWELQKLPSAAEIREQAIALTNRVLRELEELLAAPMIDEDYDGPLLLSSLAAAQLHATIPAQASGDPAPLSDYGRLLELEPHWQDELGKAVMPDFINLIDDPLAAGAGHYELDAQGVPAQRIELVRAGILHTLLMANHPNDKITESNGHRPLVGRRRRPVHLQLDAQQPQEGPQPSQAREGLAREYLRASTTVANAYVRPLAEIYLERLEQALRAEGIPGGLFLMLSNGGLTHVSEAKRAPVQLLESGPAAGALAGAWFGRNAGLERVLAFDMGGTTAKLALVDDGEPLVAYGFEAAREKRFLRGSGLPIQIATVELIEIGAGGGSIAHKSRARHAQCRSREQRRPAGPGLLRPRRHRRHRHRRRSDARLSQRRLLPGRRDEDRPRRDRRGVRHAGRGARRRAVRAPPSACTTWSTRTWRAPRAWPSPSAAAFRPNTRCWRPAARGRCMPGTSRASSASSASSVRPARAPAAPSAC